MTKKTQAFYSNGLDANGNKDPVWTDCFFEGILGGFSFADGTKSIIYQCGDCGAILEKNTTFNQHKKEKHLTEDNIIFGSADPQPLEELSELGLKESQIIREAKKCATCGKVASDEYYTCFHNMIGYGFEKKGEYDSNE
jgi:hypothetical protein